MNLPDPISQLFLDLGNLRPDAKIHASLIIERILKIGDVKAVKWMFEMYEASYIKDVAVSSRELTRRDVVFWSMLLSVSLSEFQWTSKY